MGYMYTCKRAYRKYILMLLEPFVLEVFMKINYKPHYMRFYEAHYAIVAFIVSL